MMDQSLLPPHREWLEARGISATLAEKFGLRSATASFPPTGESEEWTRARCIAVPYVQDGKVVNHKYRRVEPKQHVMDKGGKLCLWNYAAVKAAAGGTLVLTEGEWDAMLATDLGWQASSVPNGTPEKAAKDIANDKRYEYLWDARDDLLKVKHFILAVDGDSAGQVLRSDLISLLGPVKCSFLLYPEGTKDLTDVYLKHGVEQVASLLNSPKPVPVQGLHRLSDFPDMPNLEMQPILGIEEFDRLFGLVEGTWCPITGWPGSGKTSLLFKLIANIIAGGKHVTLLSAETMPKPVLERRILAALDERNEHDPTIWKNKLAREIMEERLAVIANTPDEDHELSLDLLLDQFEAAHARFKTSLCIIDPWNEIEHKKRRDENETEYTGRAIRQMKRFCSRTRVPMWVVAHPRKPDEMGMPKKAPSLYDIAGSANWYNKADYGPVIHRTDVRSDEIIFMNTKLRVGLPGETGKVVLRFNRETSRYSYAGDA